MLSEKTEKRVRALISGNVSDLIVTILTTAKAELGPSDERMEAVGKGARAITKQVTLGFQDAIDETRAGRENGRIPEGRGSVLWAAGEFAESGNTLFYGLGAAIGVLAIGMVGMLIWFSRRFKAHQSELKKREEALALVTEAIKSTEEKPWAGELQNALRQKLRDQNGGEYMRKFLKGRSELRFNPKTV